MQQQSSNDTQKDASSAQIPFLQRIQLAIRLVRIFFRAMELDAQASQVEATLAENFRQQNFSEQEIQAFRDALERPRKSRALTFKEDTYMIGGVLAYCAIFLPMVVNIGIPDIAMKIAWIAFAIAFPCAIGFFLFRFLKEENTIAEYGKLHSTMALVAVVGVLVATTSLLFHVWYVVGYIFLTCGVLVLAGYFRLRWKIYYAPFLRILKIVLKKLGETSSQSPQP